MNMGHGPIELTSQVEKVFNRSVDLVDNSILEQVKDPAVSL